ncbi:MAG: heavy-metal-associated domain-containing protein [Chloroflexota bacterium]
MTKVEYSVPNISCGGCVHTVQTEVSDINGVEQVVADRDGQTVMITFDAPATEEKIIALMKEINYPPVIP